MPSNGLTLTRWSLLVALSATLLACGWVDSGVDKNQAPQPGDDVYALAEGGTLEVSAESGVLVNDSDGGSVPLSALLDEGPVHATEFELQDDGSFRYVHDGSEALTDSFTYTASDGIKTSASQTVTLTITPVNDAPRISGQNDDPLSIEEDAPVDVLAHLMVEDPDNAYPDDFAISVAPGPHYSAEGTTIIPEPEYSGVLTVPLTVNDGELNSNLFTLTITVSAVNDPPVVSGQADTMTPEDVPLTITLADLAVTDVDSPGEDFQLKLLAPTPEAGYSVDGTTIHPAPNFFGWLSVALVVSDGSVDSAPFTLAVQVAPVNDQPGFTSTAVGAATEDSPYSYAVATTDPDLGDTRTITATTKPSWLTLTDHGNGTATLSGTPTDDHVGTNNISLRVTDAGGASATQSFSSRWRTSTTHRGSPVRRRSEPTKTNPTATRFPHRIQTAATPSPSRRPPNPIGSPSETTAKAARDSAARRTTTMWVNIGWC